MVLYLRGNSPTNTMSSNRLISWFHLLFLNYQTVCFMNFLQNSNMKLWMSYWAVTWTFSKGLVFCYLFFFFTLHLNSIVLLLVELTSAPFCVILLEMRSVIYLYRHSSCTDNVTADVYSIGFFKNWFDEINVFEINIYVDLCLLSLQWMCSNWTCAYSQPWWCDTGWLWCVFCACLH